MEEKEYAFKRPHEGHNDANFDLLAKSELLTGENTVEAINENTEKEIANNEVLLEKQLASDKENTEKVITSNEALSEKQLTSNKENSDNIVEAISNIDVKLDNTDIVNSLDNIANILQDSENNGFFAVITIINEDSPIIENNEIFPYRFNFSAQNSTIKKNIWNLNTNQLVEIDSLIENNYHFIFLNYLPSTDDDSDNFIGVLRNYNISNNSFNEYEINCTINYYTLSSVSITSLDFIAYIYKKGE